MISFQVVQLEDLAQQGRDFNWKRPVCKCGNKKPWKHAFVSRYFDGFARPLFCSVFRCSICKSVITTRHESHFERIQASIAFVLFVLTSRLSTGFWPSSVTRQRAIPWLQSVVSLSRFHGLDPHEVLSRIEATHHPNLRNLVKVENPPLSFVVQGDSAG